jgi:hypothetical protein
MAISGTSTRWGGLRLEPYDPQARDADGDGIIQEGTAWERPDGTFLQDSAGSPIAAGANSATRLRGVQVVDAQGNQVDYTPSYETAGGAAGGTALSEHGAVSIGESGLPSIRDLVTPPQQPVSVVRDEAPEASRVPEPEKPDAPKPEPDKLKPLATGYRTEHTRWYSLEGHRDQEVNNGNDFPDISKYPGYEAIWITDTPEAAERYGDDVREVDLTGAIPLVADGDDGFLYIRPIKKPEPEKPDAPNPEAESELTAMTPKQIRKKNASIKQKLIEAGAMVGRIDDEYKEARQKEADEGTESNLGVPVTRAEAIARRRKIQANALFSVRRYLETGEFDANGEFALREVDRKSIDAMPDELKTLVLESSDQELNQMLLSQASRVQEEVKGGGVRVKMTWSKLAGFIRDGRYKTVFDRGTATDNAGVAGRTTTDARVIGIPPSAPVDVRPAAGYLITREVADLVDDGAGGEDQKLEKRLTGVSEIYGDITIDLKPEVLDRTAWSLGDSINHGGPGVVGMDEDDPEYIASVLINGSGQKNSTAVILNMLESERNGSTRGTTQSSQLGFGATEWRSGESTHDYLEANIAGSFDLDEVDSIRINSLDALEATLNVDEEVIDEYFSQEFLESVGFTESQIKFLLERKKQGSYELKDFVGFGPLYKLKSKQQAVELVKKLKNQHGVKLLMGDSGAEVTVESLEREVQEAMNELDAYWDGLKQKVADEVQEELEDAVAEVIEAATDDLGGVVDGGLSGDQIRAKNADIERRMRDSDVHFGRVDEDPEWLEKRKDGDFFTLALDPEERTVVRDEMIRNAVKVLKAYFSDEEPPAEALVSGLVKFSERSVTNLMTKQALGAAPQELKDLVVGLSEDELVEMLRGACVALHERMSEGQVGIAITPEDIVQLFVGNEYKTQSVLAEEGDASDSAPAYLRASYEQNLGYPANVEVDPRLRPAATYILHPDVIDAEDSQREAQGLTELHPLSESRTAPVAGYGQVHLVLKPEVKGRGAYLQGDSFNSRGQPIRFDETDPDKIMNAVLSYYNSGLTGGEVHKTMPVILNMLHASMTGDFGHVTRLDGFSTDLDDASLGGHFYYEMALAGSFGADEIEEVVVPFDVLGVYPRGTISGTQGMTPFSTQSAAAQRIDDFVDRDELVALGATEQDLEDFDTFLEQMAEADFPNLYRGGLGTLRSQMQGTSSDLAKASGYIDAMYLKSVVQSRGARVRFTHEQGVDITDPKLWGATKETIRQEIQRRILKDLRKAREAIGPPSNSSTALSVGDIG